MPVKVQGAESRRAPARVAALPRVREVAHTATSELRHHSFIFHSGFSKIRTTHIRDPCRVPRVYIRYLLVRNLSVETHPLSTLSRRANLCRFFFSNFFWWSRGGEREVSEHDVNLTIKFIVLPIQFNSQVTNRLSPPTHVDP